MGDEDISDLVVLYTTGHPGMLLCAWMANIDEDPYIDEYGEVRVYEAVVTLRLMTND
jgi:hypothetical protein